MCQSQKKVAQKQEPLVLSIQRQDNFDEYRMDLAQFFREALNFLNVS